MGESTKVAKSTKTRVSGFIQFPSETDLDLIRNALKDHIQLTHEEPGCLRFRVIEDETTPGRFTVDEKFESQAAFEHHQERTHESAWAQVSAQAERQYSFH